MKDALERYTDEDDQASFNDAVREAVEQEIRDWDTHRGGARNDPAFKRLRQRSIVWLCASCLLAERRKGRLFKSLSLLVWRPVRRNLSFGVPGGCKTLAIRGDNTSQVGRGQSAGLLEDEITSDRRHMPMARQCFS